MNSSLSYEQHFTETAVKLRFATREQIAAAQSESSGGDQDNLAERLIRRQIITPAEAAAIAAVAEQQVNRHSHAEDLQESDAHTTRVADPALTRAEPPPTSQQPADVRTFATAAYQPAEAMGEFARFTVLRPHAKGGLGQVMIAKDLQLNREIALKEILPAHADDSVSRQRFLREAEITGALEHPGVVPVYSLGEYPDGRPFYAMRFVHGQDMHAAIDRLHGDSQKNLRNNLDFRQLLGRFVDVCQAVDYAHNRGVVHRDIKPGNIMLGDYGETLVVDWGLARPTDDPDERPSTLRRVKPSARSSDSHTQDGQMVGTPAYMSPEQAAGRLDLLGPATDIYSLGATLYHLLTGHSPHASASDNSTDNATRGRFPPPHQSTPHVARPLEAICLRAMAFHPGDRYATASELALDVERYLADEKVDAYAEPVWASAWRWVRNHRTAVLSLVAAATVAMAAMTAGVILMGASNKRERAARLEATRNFAEASKQRDRAEQNFSLAQEAVRNYYTQVSEETLLSQPGMQPLRNALLQQALTYYEHFLKQRGDDPALHSELAQAAFFVGRITETVDSPELALPYYAQSLELYEKLADDASENESAEQQANYARVLNAVGGAQQKLRQLDKARDSYNEAREIRQRLAAADPDDLERARELSNTLMNLGSVALRSGDSDEAIRQLQHAQSLRLAHIGDANMENSETPLKLQRDLAKGYFNLAAAQLAANQADPAQRNLIQAAAAFAILAKREPAAVDPQRRLAVTRRLLGDLAGARGRNGPAIEYYQQARDSLHDLVKHNARVPDFQVDLAGVLMNLGAQQARSGEFEPALAHLEQAAALLADLADKPEAPPHYRRDLAAARRAAGQVLATLDRPADARDKLNESREILRALVREFPDDQDYAAQLQETLAAIEALGAQ